MGILIFPEFDRKIQNPFKTTGEFLGATMESLEDIAETLDLTPLSAFGDNREVPEDFDGPPDELNEILGPWDEWFDCADGAFAIEAIRAALESNPATRLRVECVDEVVEELNDLRQQLLAGKQQEARFRLLLSF